MAAVVARKSTTTGNRIIMLYYCCILCGGRGIGESVGCCIYASVYDTVSYIRQKLAQ